MKCANACLCYSGLQETNLFFVVDILRKSQRNHHRVTKLLQSAERGEVI